MQKSILSFILLLIMIVCYSCHETEVLPTNNSTGTKITNSSFRESFVSISKEEYFSYSSSEKKIFWIQKLNYILEKETLINIQISLINELKDQIQSLDVDVFEFNNDIKETALELAENFSETDFINVFSTLDVTQLSGLNGTTCLSCIRDINELPQDPMPLGLPNCNCRWTCGQDEVASTTCYGPLCCQRTTFGCGFMFMQPCTGRDSL